jgi:C4-type Zn-finger protein
MKSATGQMGFKIIITCPYCTDEFDLIDHDDNNEGFWTMKFREWIGNKKGADKCDETVECPTCENDVQITGFEY